MKDKAINTICALGGYNSCLRLMLKNKYISKKKLRKYLDIQAELLASLNDIVKNSTINGN